MFTNTASLVAYLVQTNRIICHCTAQNTSKHSTVRTGTNHRSVVTKTRSKRAAEIELEDYSSKRDVISIDR